VTIRFPICGFLLVLHWNQAPISKRFRDIRLQIYLGHDLDLLGSREVIGHVTIWYPYSISYGCSIVTNSLDIFQILGPKHIGVTTLTFQGHMTSSITWRFDSHMGFPISAPLEPSPYLQAFSRYLTPNISGSRPWPFGVMWGHRACDHLIPNIAFPISYSIYMRLRYKITWLREVTALRLQNLD